MNKTEFDLIAERLQGKNDAFALAYMLTYAHAKTVNTTTKANDYLARKIQDNYEILKEMIPEVTKDIYITPDHIKSKPTFEDVDVKVST